MRTTPDHGPKPVLRSLKAVVNDRAHPTATSPLRFGLAGLSARLKPSWRGAGTQTPDSRRPHRGGFSMIEVTVAVAITGVALLAIMGLTATGIQASRRVSDETLTANVTDDMLNWSRITPFGKQSYLPYTADLSSRTTYTDTQLDANGNLSVTDYNNGGTAFANNFWTGTTVSGNKFGSYRVTFQTMANPQFPSCPDLTRVLVTVQWPINPGTGAAVPNCNTRYYIGQVARK